MIQSRSPSIKSLEKKAWINSEVWFRPCKTFCKNIKRIGKLTVRNRTSKKDTRFQTPPEATLIMDQYSRFHLFAQTTKTRRHWVESKENYFSHSKTTIQTIIRGIFWPDFNANLVFMQPLFKLPWLSRSRISDFLPCLWAEFFMNAKGLGIFSPFFHSSCLSVVIPAKIPSSAYYFSCQKQSL